MTKTVPTDDKGHVPGIGQDLVEVFGKTKVETLPLHWSSEYAIDLEHGY